MASTVSEDTIKKGKRKKEKSPAFQFYPKDFLTDEKVVCMTNEQLGQYVRLLCLDWLNDGLQKDLWPELNGGSTLVASCFTDHASKRGFVTNKRLVKEREKQKVWSKKSSEAGKRSGNVRKLRALQKEPRFNQGSTNPQPKPNSSSPSSSPINDNYNKTIFTLLSSSEFGPILNSWIEYRREIGKPLKPSGIKAILKSYDGKPDDLARDVQWSMKQGYQGLFAPTEKTFNGNGVSHSDRKHQEKLDYIAKLERGEI